MNTNAVISVVIISIVVILLGVGLWQTSGSTTDVTTKISELTAPQESTVIDTTILEQQNIKDIEALKTYGNRPVGADPGSLKRPNPFEGI